jgi:cytochrome c biogenesis protein CcdA/glutaredoxin
LISLNNWREPLGNVSAAMRILVLLMAVLLPTFAAAAHPVDVDLFYGQGCPHCADMREALLRLRQRYPELQVREHEVYFDRENARLFERVARGYGAAIEGVPTVFVGERMIVGYSDEIEAELAEAIRNCGARGCLSPLGRAAGGAPRALTASAVVAGAAVDAINPCEFAVLIILISAILASGGRRRALGAGLAFSLSVFVSYYLMGLGLYSAVQAASLTRAVYVGAGLLAILIGLFNLKDYLWYGKWFAMEVPQSWRPALKRLLQGVSSIPGAFLIGFVVSLFLLPCTSGPYIVVLGMLAKSATRGEAAAWLLLYNAIFVTPMILITAAVYAGWTSAEKLEQWRTQRLRLLHLVAGVVLLALGAGLLASLRLGLL